MSASDCEGPDNLDPPLAGAGDAEAEFRPIPRGEVKILSYREAIILVCPPKGALVSKTFNSPEVEKVTKL